GHLDTQILTPLASSTGVPHAVARAPPPRPVRPPDPTPVDTGHSPSGPPPSRMRLPKRPHLPSPLPKLHRPPPHAHIGGDRPHAYPPPAPPLAPGHHRRRRRPRGHRTPDQRNKGSRPHPTPAPLPRPLRPPRGRLPLPSQPDRRTPHRGLGPEEQ